MMPRCYPVQPGMPSANDGFVNLGDKVVNLSKSPVKRRLFESLIEKPLNVVKKALHVSRDPSNHLCWEIETNRILEFCKQVWNKIRQEICISVAAQGRESLYQWRRLTRSCLSAYTLPSSVLTLWDYTKYGEVKFLFESLLMYLDSSLGHALLFSVMNVNKYRYVATESFYKLVMAFSPIPDLHIMWLLHFYEAHQEILSWVEAAQCVVIVAGVVMQVKCARENQDEHALIGLFLRLDSVPGVDPTVRELRRDPSHRIVRLQEILDAVSDTKIQNWDGFLMDWDDVVERMKMDDSVQLDERLAFVEDPVSILARDVRWLHCRVILVVKVSTDVTKKVVSSSFIFPNISKDMAPRGCIYKQKTLTGETISATQSVDPSNKSTPATITGNTIHENLVKLSYSGEEYEGMKPDRIDFYTHYSTGKGWSSEQAEANYERNQMF
ncbi:BAG family molecular chaperone regulator 5, mitochondrial [Capsicum baccatum]|uniref:BAG family molecular chaperone regulator 5, mitochondrial n=1 Tax=Capsicum baccatum TaxID=33114 RepID=A0A2G2W3U0_CAPBA|nr:BAG family molecular chaperone regulator 5, mitochondrial [Capsicum baccatum]